MTGFLILLGLAIAILLALRVLGRVKGDEALLATAALFVAAAGYTWQGSPGLAGAPVKHDEGVQGLRPDTLFVVERTRLLHVYGEPAQYLILADGLARTGDDLGAAQVLAGAVAHEPKSTVLKIDYAHALFAVTDYNFTPAVALAFDRAIAADPADPSARYFEALAHFEAGDVLTAVKHWGDLDQSLPPGSDWRKELDKRLAMIAQMMQRAEAGRATGPAR